MLETIAYATVFVSDQDKALDFYTNVLGFEQRFDNPTPDGPRFLTVGLPEQEFQLVLWPGTPGQAKPLNSHTPGAYTIDTADCRNDPIARTVGLGEAAQLDPVCASRCVRVAASGLDARRNRHQSLSTKRVSGPGRHWFKPR